MKSVTQAARDSGISVKLIKAVIRQMGLSAAKYQEDLRIALGDVNRHGSSSGVSGFIYHTETCKFYQRNKKEILASLKSQADDFGTSVIAMVQDFSGMKDEGEDAIGRVLYGRAKNDDTQVENCLAWYALEEVARAMVDE